LGTLDRTLVEAECDDDGVEPGGASRLSLRARRGSVYLIEVTRSSDAAGDGLGNILALRVSPEGG
jgi:hypothetical protein